MKLFVFFSVFIMLWLFSAIGGYGATALSGVADKFLVSGRIEKPAAYVLVLTLFSLTSFALAPFGLQLLPPVGMVIFLASGMLFAWSLLFLFTAFQLGEVSRVLPLVGIFSAMITLVPSIVLIFLSGDVPIFGLISFALLLAGVAMSFFLSLRWPFLLEASCRPLIPFRVVARGILHSHQGGGGERGKFCEWAYLVSIWRVSWWSVFGSCACVSSRYAFFFL